MSAYVFASQSFTPDEVRFLRKLWPILARGGDVTVLAARPEYAAIYRKILSMEKRIAKLEKKRRLSST